MRRTFAWLLFFVIGCGPITLPDDAAERDAGFDGGGRLDATPSDGGTRDATPSDAPTPLDAPVWMDTREDDDAGNDDGGGEADVGAGSMDSGTSVDVGAPDASAPLDAAIPIDAPLAIDAAVALDAPVDAGVDAGTVLPPWPGVVREAISSDRAVYAFVSPDEQRIGYATTYAASGTACENGLGNLTVASVDGSGVVSLVPVTGRVNLRESGFTGDGAHIAYTTYAATSPCSSGRQYRVARADGTVLGTAGSANYFTDMSRLRSGMVWRSFSAGASDPGTLYSAYLGTGSLRTNFFGSGTGDRIIRPSPTGEWVIYDDGAAMVLERAYGFGTEVRLVPDVYAVVAGSVWSNDGTQLAIVHGATAGARSLDIRLLDGTTRTVASGCSCRSVAFSPDGSLLAYDVNDADGIAFRVLDVAAGTSVRLDADGLWTPSGVPPVILDNRWLLVNSGLVGSLASDGVMRRIPEPGPDYTYDRLTDRLAVRYFAAGFESRVVVLDLDAATETFVASGSFNFLGYADASDGQGLAYYDYVTHEVFVVSRDGVTPLAMLSDASAPFWAGRGVVARIRPRREGSVDVWDLAYMLDDGRQGILASGVREFFLRRDPDPNYVYFTDSAGLARVRVPAP